MGLQFVQKTSLQGNVLCVSRDTYISQSEPHFREISFADFLCCYRIFSADNEFTILFAAYKEQ